MKAGHGSAAAVTGGPAGVKGQHRDADPYSGVGSSAPAFVREFLAPYSPTEDDDSYDDSNDLSRSAPNTSYVRRALDFDTRGTSSELSGENGSSGERHNDGGGVHSPKRGARRKLSMSSPDLGKRPKSSATGSPDVSEARVTRSKRMAASPSRSWLLEEAEREAAAGSRALPMPEAGARLDRGRPIDDGSSSEEDGADGYQRPGHNAASGAEAMVRPARMPSPRKRLRPSGGAPSGRAAREQLEDDIDREVSDMLAELRRDDTDGDDDTEYGAKVGSRTGAAFSDRASEGPSHGEPIVPRLPLAALQHSDQDNFSAGNGVDFKSSPDTAVSTARVPGGLGASATDHDPLAQSVLTELDEDVANGASPLLRMNVSGSGAAHRSSAAIVPEHLEAGMWRPTSRGASAADDDDDVIVMSEGEEAAVLAAGSASGSRSRSTAGSASGGSDKRGPSAGHITVHSSTVSEVDDSQFGDVQKQLSFSEALEAEDKSQAEVKVAPAASRVAETDTAGASGQHSTPGGDAVETAAAVSLVKAGAMSAAIRMGMVSGNVAASATEEPPSSGRIHHVSRSAAAAKASVAAEQWRVAQTDDGRTYYFNKVTKETSWDPPSMDSYLGPRVEVDMPQSIVRRAGAVVAGTRSAGPRSVASGTRHADSSSTKRHSAEECKDGNSKTVDGMRYRSSIPVVDEDDKGYDGGGDDYELRSPPRSLRHSQNWSKTPPSTRLKPPGTDLQSGGHSRTKGRTSPAQDLAGLLDKAAAAEQAIESKHGEDRGFKHPEQQASAEVAKAEAPATGDVDEWRSATTADGRLYYYNRRTRQSSWKLPAGYTGEVKHRGPPPKTDSGAKLDLAERRPEKSAEPGRPADPVVARPDATVRHQSPARNGTSAAAAAPSPMRACPFCGSRGEQESLAWHVVGCATEKGAPGTTLSTVKAMLKAGVKSTRKALAFLDDADSPTGDETDSEKARLSANAATAAVASAASAARARAEEADRKAAELDGVAAGVDRVVQPRGATEPGAAEPGTVARDLEAELDAAAEREGSVHETSTSHDDEAADEAAFGDVSNEDILAAQQREQCPDCSRWFAPKGLAVHRRICRDVFCRKRPAYDGRQARTRNTPLQQHWSFQVPEPCSRCGKTFSHTEDAKYHAPLCSGHQAGVRGNRSMAHSASPHRRAGGGANGPSSAPKIIPARHGRGDASVEVRQARHVAQAIEAAAKAADADSHAEAAAKMEGETSHASGASKRRDAPSDDRESKSGDPVMSSALLRRLAGAEEVDEASPAAHEAVVDTVDASPASVAAEAYSDEDDMVSPDEPAAGRSAGRPAAAGPASAEGVNLTPVDDRDMDDAARALEAALEEADVEAGRKHHNTPKQVLTMAPVQCGSCGARLVGLVALASHMAECSAWEHSATTDSARRLEEATAGALSEHLQHRAAMADARAEACTFCDARVVPERLSEHLISCPGLMPDHQPESRSRGTRDRRGTAKQGRSAGRAGPAGGVGRGRDEGKPQQASGKRAVGKAAVRGRSQERRGRRRAGGPASRNAGDRNPAELFSPPINGSSRLVASALQMEDNRVPCPHCNRKFGPGAAERHFDVCKNVKARPSPVKKDRLAQTHSGSMMGRARTTGTAGTRRAAQAAKAEAQAQAAAAKRGHTRRHSNPATRRTRASAAPTFSPTYD